jgi:hypothetical protein
MQDYILNGQGFGSVAATLMRNDFDISVLRMWEDPETHQSYVTRNLGGKPTPMLVRNATATLLKDEWQLLDEVVIKAAKPRLRAFGDLRAMGLQYTIPDGMGKGVFQYQAQSDITPATISMDGLRRSESDRPIYDLVNLPLPIIHKDFQFSAREVMMSRGRGNPLDTTTAELAGRRVAEQAEQLLLGTSSSYQYGGGTIYGYTNFPNRITYTMTNPTAGGWIPGTTVNEILAMRTLSQQAYHFGPWMLYNSIAWDTFLDDDYSASKGDKTLRERLESIKGIMGVRTLDYLTGYTMLMVQMTSDVARAVVGMDIVTVQWESEGGMQLNFKVMAILVPQIRADHNGNTGLIHGAAA